MNHTKRVRSVRTIQTGIPAKVYQIISPKFPEKTTERERKVSTMKKAVRTGAIILALLSAMTVTNSVAVPTVFALTDSHAVAADSDPTVTPTPPNDPLSSAASEEESPTVGVPADNTLPDSKPSPDTAAPDPAQETSPDNTDSGQNKPEAPAVIPPTAVDPTQGAAEVLESLQNTGTSEKEGVSEVPETMTMTVGSQKTVYLSSVAFSSYRIADTNIATVTAVSKNVLSITAKSIGTTTLTTVDANGVQRKTRIQVEYPISRVSVGDFVSYATSKTPVKSTIETNNTMLIRRMTLSTGTLIRYLNRTDTNYEYRYSLRNTDGNYITVKKASTDSSYRIRFTEAGTYYLKLKVTDPAENQSCIEMFVFTVQGAAVTDEFSSQYTNQALSLDLNTRTVVTLPSNITTVWRSSSDLRCSYSGKELILRGPQEGYSDLFIQTENGTMYRLIVRTGITAGFLLSSDKLTLENGKTASVPIKTVAPGITLSYRSANTKIVKVSSDGTVTAVGAGKTTITITASDGSASTVSVTVNTSQVSLNKTSALIKPGTTLQLKATMDSGSPNTITFTSSNPAVATVDATGKVTAVAKGKSLIKAKTNNGKIAYCTVTVTNTTSATTVKFLGVPPTVHVGKVVTVNVTASDSSVNDEIKVSSSDTAIATVSYSNGVVKIKGKGMGKATLTLTLPNGKKATQYVYSVGNYNDYRTNYMVEKGIDVSCYNVGMDYKALKKAGFTFVIIRAGFGTHISQKDELFEQHIRGAKEAGLGIGIYYFSYAVNAADAKKEAQICCQIIDKYRDDIKYGVYYDYEDDSTRYATNMGYPVTKSIVTAMTVTFCEEVERHGFMAGVYTNTAYGTTYLDMNRISSFLFWYAAPYATTYAFDFDIWQYSFTVTADGIYGVADGNKIFSEIFNIMK